MAQYLTLMRKQDFSDLFKYGYIHANRDLIIEFTGNISYVAGNFNYFKGLTQFVNPIEESFTYLIVQYSKKNTDGRIADLEIQDVEAIYPLDVKAKSLLEEDFGPAVKFSKPLWNNGMDYLERQQAIKNSKKGAENIFKIFGLSSEDYRMCSEFIPENILKEVIGENLSGKRPEGDLSIWVYILRYERHSMYPNTTLGNCMDAVHAITNYSQKKEFSSIEASNIFKYLDSLDYNLRLNEYVKNIFTNELTAAFAKFANSIIPNHNILLTASIYYVLLGKYQDVFHYEKQFIESCKKSWPQEFKLASYLLGWVLGHTRTFESLYEHVSLPIIKTKITYPVNDGETFKVAEDSDKSKVDSNNVISTSDYNGKDIITKTDFSSNPMLHKMGKLKKKPQHSKDVIKKTIITVKSKAEYDKRIAEGYIVID